MVKREDKVDQKEIVKVKGFRHYLLDFNSSSGQILDCFFFIQILFQ